MRAYENLRLRKGFTLVELVVVILILGILAGVAAPKFVNTSGTATDNSLKQTLGIVRDAIELYTAQNNGALPPSTDQTAFKTALAGYVRGSFPVSPVGKKDAAIRIASTVGAAADNTTGWQYNSADGTFIANCTDASKTSPSTLYSQF